MPVFTLRRGVMLPGKRQAWGQFTRQLKEAMASHNIVLTASQLVAGGPANGFSTVTMFPDWETFGAKRDAIASDAAMQGLMQSLASNPDVPFMADVEVQIGCTVDELNEGIEPVPMTPGSIAEFTTINIAPGCQPKAYALIREMKAAIRAAGLTPAMTLSPISGADVNQLIRAQRFENWAAYAAAQQGQPGPEVQAVIARAREDRDFPFLHIAGRTLMLDIIEQL